MAKKITLKEIGDMMAHVVKHMATKEDIAALRKEMATKDQLFALQTQVNSIETRNSLTRVRAPAANQGPRGVSD